MNTRRDDTAADCADFSWKPVSYEFPPVPFFFIPGFLIQNRYKIGLERIHRINTRHSEIPFILSEKLRNLCVLCGDFL
jgi:hypothetical protein